MTKRATYWYLLAGFFWTLCTLKCLMLEDMFMVKFWFAAQATAMLALLYHCFAEGKKKTATG